MTPVYSAWSCWTLNFNKERGEIHPGVSFTPLASLLQHGLRSFYLYLKGLNGSGAAHAADSLSLYETSRSQDKVCNDKTMGQPASGCERRSANTND